MAKSEGPTTRKTSATVLKLRICSLFSAIQLWDPLWTTTGMFSPVIMDNDTQIIFKGIPYQVRFSVYSKRRL